MSEYPDHLNPFKDSEKKKIGKTLTRSFRELKGFLRQSFRKKKNKDPKKPDFEDVEIRKTYDSQCYNTLRYNVMSLPSPPTYSSYTSPPLPRSRFKERLSRSSLNDTFNSTYDEKCNPFAEEGLNPFDDPPVPYRRRKSKKKAPIPPSSSNPEVNYGLKARGSSKWSLTSSETDYTLDDKSEYSGDVTYSHSLRECLDNFNKEMDTLNKGSIEMGGSSPNILAGARTKILDETEYSTKSADFLRAAHSREINNNFTENLNEHKVYYPDSEEVVSEMNEEVTESHLEQADSDKTKDDFNGNHIEDEQTDVQDIHSDIKQENGGIDDIRIEKNVPDSDHVVIIHKETEDFEIDEKRELLNEVKLEYIDEENGVSEQNRTENSEDSEEPSLTPKLRKIKLNKDVLLGEPLLK